MIQVPVTPRTPKTPRKDPQKAPRFYPVVKDTNPPADPTTPRKRKTRYSANPPVEHHVGWVMDARDHRPRTSSFRLVFILHRMKMIIKMAHSYIFYYWFSGSSPPGSLAEGGSVSYGSTPQSLPTFQHPSHALLKENGFTQQVYHKYRSRCLKGMAK